MASHIHRDAASHNLLTGPTTEGSVANHQAQLRSQINLPARWQWNTAAYFVGRLPALGVPSYTRLDSNLTWFAGERFSISLVGQNLVRDRHLEYAGTVLSVQPDLIRRSAYVNLSWSF